MREFESKCGANAATMYVSHRVLADPPHLLVMCVAVMDAASIGFAGMRDGFCVGAESGGGLMEVQGGSVTGPSRCGPGIGCKGCNDHLECRPMSQLSTGERIHLVDKKGRQYTLTLKAGEIYQFSGQKISHDEMIGRPDGTVVTLSGGKKMLALRPTFGDYVLKMPRGAQVLYPKDLALIPMWADVYPGARVFEAGTGSGALTMALLRLVGPQGLVVTYDLREDFAKTALTNINRYLGPTPNLVSLRKSAYEGIDLLDDGVPFDRVVLDLPEPWQVVPHAAKALRSGGIYLSFVPTVPQVVQTVEALERATVFGMVETFESLIRTWSVQGRSVRPDHRMVAHSGFITVARKVEPGLLGARREADPEESDFADTPRGHDMDEAAS